MYIEIYQRIDDIAPAVISKLLNPCHAEYIKMPCPLLIFSQSDNLIQAVDTKSHT